MEREKDGTATVENSSSVTQKVKYVFPYDPQFCFYVYIPEYWKHIQTKRCTQTFIAALITMAKCGDKSNVHKQRKWLTKCSVSVQWNII